MAWRARQVDASSRLKCGRARAPLPQNDHPQQVRAAATGTGVKRGRTRGGPGPAVPQVGHRTRAGPSAFARCKGAAGGLACSAPMRSEQRSAGACVSRTPWNDIASVHPETRRLSCDPRATLAAARRAHVTDQNLPTLIAHGKDRSPTKDRLTTFAGKQDKTTCARRNQSAGESIFKVVPAARAASASLATQRRFCLTIDASGSLDAQSWSMASKSFSSPCVAFRRTAGPRCRRLSDRTGLEPFVARASFKPLRKDGCGPVQRLHERRQRMAPVAASGAAPAACVSVNRRAPTLLAGHAPAGRRVADRGRPRGTAPHCCGVGFRRSGLGFLARRVES